MSRTYQVLGSLMGLGAGERPSAHEDLNLVPPSRGAGRRRKTNAIGRQAHAGERAHHGLGVAYPGAGLERRLAGVAPGRGDGHHVEDSARPAVERALYRAVERLLVGDVRPVESDHHQWLARRDRRRRRRHPLLRRRIRDGAILEAAAVEIAAVDRERERREILPLVADVVALAVDILAYVVAQLVDQDHDPAAVVLEDCELAVILVDRAL